MNDPRSGLGPDTLLRIEPLEGNTISEARSSVASALRLAGCAEPEEDARRLVAHALGISPSRLTLEGARVLSPEEGRRLCEYEGQRCRGRTVARIVGKRPFHDIVLRVADHVLEPRDDTAALVELALPHLRAACDRHGEARLLDVGVGAGTVALALLSADSRARGVGIDPNPTAVALARRNAEALDLAERFEAFEASGLRGSGYDMVVSNPPYIPTAQIDGLAAETRADPREALDGGADGLDFYRMLAREAEAVLLPRGVLAVEIGAGQGADVRAIMARRGWHEVGAMDDLCGHERALAFARSGPIEQRSGD